MAVFFPSGQIEGERVEVRRLLALRLQFIVDLFQFVQLDVIADAMFAVSAIHYLDKVLNTRALHTAIRRFDETVIVNTRVAGERRDKTDVRTFRRLNRADASVVRGMNVANFESSSFAR